MATRATYSSRFRLKVKNAWISGQYRTVAALSRAFGLSIVTIKTWRAQEQWDYEREKVQEAAQIKNDIDLTDQISKINKQHFTLWAAMLAQIAQRMQDANPGNSVQAKKLKISLLLEMGKLLQKIQQGQRIACDADSPEKQSRKKLSIDYEGLESKLTSSLDEDLPPGIADAEDAEDADADADVGGAGAGGEPSEG